MSTIRYATSEKLSPTAIEVIRSAVRQVYGDEPVQLEKSPAGAGVLGFGVDSGVRTLSNKQIASFASSQSALVEAFSLIKNGSQLPAPRIIDVQPGMTWVYLEQMDHMYGAPVCYDIENAPDGTLLSISVTYGQAIYVFTQDLFAVCQTLASHYYVIGHGAKSDQVKIRDAYGIKVPLWFDTMLARHVMHPAAQGHYSLKELGMRVLGLPDWETGIKKYTGTGENADYSKIPHDLLVQYNGMDVYATWHLYKRWLPIMADNPTFWYAMTGQDMLGDVEYNKVHVDVEYVKTYREELTPVIEAKLAEVQAITENLNFNPNSPQQVMAYLNASGCKVKSSNKATLDKLLEKNLCSDFIYALLEFRKVYKMRSTYLDAILRKQRDGFLWTTFNMHGTASSRLSSSNPNAQNIPREKKARKIFDSRYDNGVIVEADYAQAELRVQAILSGDPDMIAAFQPDSPDFFDALVPIAFPEAFPTLDDYLTYEHDECHGDEKDYRAKLKGVIYGLNFGRQAPAIGVALKMPTKDAQSIINNFMKAYPVYAQWRRDIVQAATDPNTRDMLTSWTGYQFEAEVLTWKSEGNIERSALSFLPQATVAGLCVTAGVRINKRLRAEYPQALLTMLVHDALYVDCPLDIAEEVGKIVSYEMEAVGRDVFGDTVLFTADYGYARSWGEIGKE